MKPAGSRACGFFYCATVLAYICTVEVVISEIIGRTGFITLNNPEKRNALGPEMVGSLKLSIQNYLNNEAVKVIVLRSHGPAFCSGADLGYLSEIRNFSAEENLADTHNLRELFDLIHAGNKVFISEVNGPALAGGCGLATICDFCFASPEASFGYTEARIGFVPALVMVYLQQRLSGKDLTEILLTAKIFSADEAARMHLINKVVPQNELEHYTLQFAEKLAETVSSDSVRLIKGMLRTLPSMSFDEGLDFAERTNVEARSTADCIRGIDAFLNKEKISW